MKKLCRVYKCSKEAVGELDGYPLCKEHLEKYKEVEGKAFDQIDKVFPEGFYLFDRFKDGNKTNSK